MSLELGDPGSVVLDDDFDEAYEPTDEEIKDYAKWLGAEPGDEDLMWIAREGLKAPLPRGWRPCQTAEGELYYFNFETGDSVWCHPSDEYYRTYFAEEKRKRLDGNRNKDPGARRATKGVMGSGGSGCACGGGGGGGRPGLALPGGGASHDDQIDSLSASQPLPKLAPLKSKPLPSLGASDGARPSTEFPPNDWSDSRAGATAPLLGSDSSEGEGDGGQRKNDKALQRQKESTEDERKKLASLEQELRDKRREVLVKHDASMNELRHEHEDAMQRLQSEHRSAREQALKEQEKIQAEDLAQKKSALKKKAERDLADEKAKAERKLHEFMEQSKEELERARSAHENSIRKASPQRTVVESQDVVAQAAADAKIEKDIRDARQKRNSTIKQIQTQIESMKEKAAEQVKKHTEEMEFERNKHLETLTALRQANMKALDEERERGQAKITEARRENERELSDLKETTQRDMKAAEEQHQRILKEKKQAVADAEEARIDREDQVQRLEKEKQDELARIRIQFEERKKGFEKEEIIGADAKARLVLLEAQTREKEEEHEKRIKAMKEKEDELKKEIELLAKAKEAKDDAAASSELKLLAPNAEESLYNEPELQIKLGEEKQRLSEARSHVSQQKKILKQRQEQLISSRNEWKQDMKALEARGGEDSERQRGVLLEVKRVLESQAEAINQEVRSLNATQRWVSLNDKKLSLVESQIHRSDGEVSSSAPSPVPILGLDEELSATLGQKPEVPAQQQVMQQLERIEGELAKVMEVIRGGLGDPLKENEANGRRSTRVRIQPAHQVNDGVRELRRKWGGYLGPAAPEVKPLRSSRIELAAFQRRVAQWSEGRDTARELLDRHTNWLRSFRQQMELGDHIGRQRGVLGAPLPSLAMGAGYRRMGM